MIGLTFLKELMLIKQSAIFVKIVRNLSLLVVLEKGFNFQPHVCNRCHDLLMMAMNLTDIAILNIKGVLIIPVLLAELAKVKP